MKFQLSTKRLMVDKNNSLTITIVALATFLATFSFFASKALLSKQSYQSKIISGKEKAVDQLKENKEAVASLTESYKKFIGNEKNVLSGITNGTGNLDGDNARIILDALPSKYDYPALASSIEKVFTDNHFVFRGIVGTDDEIAQNKASLPAEVVKIPFSISTLGNYNEIGAILSALDRSIRPMSVQQVTITGTDQQLNMSLKMETYYQPEKSLTITKKEVK